MSYRLSDKQLAKLVQLTSISDIKRRFPDYTPSIRTMYRRMEINRLNKPSEYKKDFRTYILNKIPYGITEQEATAQINKVTQEMLEDLCTSIEIEAEEYRERHNQ